MEKQIESLCEKAEKANTSGEALQYSQAACNVANALRVVSEVKTNSQIERGNTTSYKPGY